MTPEIKQRIEQIKNSEIPKGYKHSKFGIIPEDWEVLRLKDKFDRLSRKNAEGNTNVLTISAQYGLINQEEFFKKEIASDDKSNYYLLHRGEFAYNKSYSNGYPFGAIKRLSRYDKGVVSPLYICFSANSNNACPEYYEQYFEAGRLNHEIQAYAQEGARNHGLLNISVSDFFNSFILMPPIKEQKRIAKILSTQDKVIECYEKKIEQLKRMKKYYLQNMFPKRGETVPKIRFKGFIDAWEQRKVGDVLSESRDAGHSGDIAKKLTVKLWGKGVYAKGDKGSAATQYFTRHAGQFIYSKLDFLNSAFGVVPKELEGYESTADLPAFDCVDVEPYFMYYRAVQPSFYLTNGMIADGSRKAKRIHVETFLDMPLDLPSIKEQQELANFLTQHDYFITLHQRKLEEEKKKKKALQQLLLTGIVRTN